MLETEAIGVRQLEDYDDYQNVITLLTKSEILSYEKYLSILKDKNRLIVEVNDYDYKNLLNSNEEFDDVFTKEQAHEIIKFSLKHKDEPILVHCAAGISRSQAVALFIAKHIKKHNQLFNLLYHDNLKLEGGNLFIYQTLVDVSLEYPEINKDINSDVLDF